MRFPNAWPWIAAEALCFAGMALAWTLEAPRIVPVGLSMAAYGFFLLALRGLGGFSWRKVFAAALLLRLPLLFAEPAWSDDLFRYMWEGRVQVAGFNPFAEAPDSPALAHLNADGLAGKVNHGGLAAIYPPFAQMAFALGALIGADGSALAFKAWLVGLEFLAMAAAIPWLRRRRRGPGALALWALNPLAVVEVAGNGHYDFMVAGLMALFFWALLGRRGLGAGAALGAAIAAKFLPGAMGPFLALRGRAGWIAGFASLGTVALLYLPYAGAGGRLFGSLDAYALKWQRNAPLFPAAEWAVAKSGLDAKLDALTWGPGPGKAFWRKALGFHPEARHSQQIAKRAVASAWLGFAGGLFGLALWRRWRRGRVPAPEPVAEGLFGAMLLLAPILYPWYLLLLFPMLLRRFRPGWHWVFAAVPLTYLPVEPGRAEPLLSELACRWIVFGPFFALLALEALAGPGRRLAFRARRPRDRPATLGNSGAALRDP